MRELSLEVQRADCIFDLLRQVLRRGRLGSLLKLLEVGQFLLRLVLNEGRHACPLDFVASVILPRTRSWIGVIRAQRELVVKRGSHHYRFVKPQVVFHSLPIAKHTRGL